MGWIRDEWLERLKREALKSNMYKKHAACVVANGKIISVGRNESCVAHTIGFKMSHHAELQAVSRIDEKCIKNASLIVLRCNSLNQLGLSKPCKKCINRLKRYGFSSVYYSTGNANEFAKLTL